MPQDHENTQIAPETENHVDRRTALFGGAALIGAALSGLPEAQAQTAPAGMFRRIVTGNNAQGKSYVIKDEMVKAGDRWRTSAEEPLGPGAPGDTPGVMPSYNPNAEPPVCGTQGYFLTFPPTKGTLADIRATTKGWDRTGSVVHVLVLDNEITMVHDIGETKFKAGELMVLRNSLHAWYNHTDKPTNIFAVKIR